VQIGIVPPPALDKLGNRPAGLDSLLRLKLNDDALAQMAMCSVVNVCGTVLMTMHVDSM
jgi:hypothetical protein